jgi:hypothetical protein
MTGDSAARATDVRAALRDFRAVRYFDFTPPSLLELRVRRDELAHRCARVENITIDTDVIGACYRDLAAVGATHAPMATIPRRTLRWVPLAFFHPAAEPKKWLVRNSHLLQEYLRYVETSRNRQALVRLLRAFVLNYEPSLPTFEQLRTGLRRLLDSFDSPRIVERRRWADEHQVFAADGPRAFVSGWSARPASLPHRLATLGGEGELAVSRFVAAVERALCLDISRLGADLNEQQFATAIDVLSAKGGGPPRFREASLGPAIANAILPAFASARPSDRLRLSIRQAFVERLGDPRLASNFAAWSGVSARAMNVFRRWLVDDTLRVFFELISESAQNSPDRASQWNARRQFWSRYLDHISDAWVALSPAAARVASEAPAFRDVPHGRMDDPARVNSVLIMAIEDIMLVEFSHVGGVRYWRAEDRDTAPELFKERYGIQDFKVNQHFNIPHNGAWQARVAAVIRSETGVEGKHR